MPRPSKTARVRVTQEQLTRFYSESLPRQLIELATWARSGLYERIAERGHHGLRRSHETLLVPLPLAGSRLVDIARASNVSKNAIGQLADELEAMGYVERVPDAADRRAKNLRYTARGLRMVAAGVAAGEALDGEVSALLGERKSAQLKKLVGELVEKLRAQRAAADGDAEVEVEDEEV